MLTIFFSFWFDKNNGSETNERKSRAKREEGGGGEVEEVIKIDFSSFSFFSLSFNFFFSTFLFLLGLKKFKVVVAFFFISFLRRLVCVSVVIFSLVLPSRSLIAGVLLHWYGATFWDMVGKSAASWAVKLAFIESVRLRFMLSYDGLL